MRCLRHRRCCSGASAGNRRFSFFKQFPDPSRLSIYSDPTGDTPVETLVKGPGLNSRDRKAGVPQRLLPAA